MKQVHSIVGLIPLRGGSKSIPLKNIKVIAGKPLFAWCIEAALKSEQFDKIIVSTDSKQIENEVKNIFPEIEVLERPKELATDLATTESVMLHLAKFFRFNILITIQATSPLTTSKDFINALNQFRKDNLDSLLTGVKIKKFIWSLNGKPLNFNPQYRPMRQNFEGSFIENGAFYITKRKILQKYKCRLGGKIGIYAMSNENNIEVDELTEWDEVEKILVKRNI